MLECKGTETIGRRIQVSAATQPADGPLNCLTNFGIKNVNVKIV